MKPERFPGSGPATHLAAGALYVARSSSPHRNRPDLTLDNEPIEGVPSID
jgi:hypothetical protein